ncbi:MAG: hypothetical protein CBARDCOR_6406 [uncultured Caballeronia sp.]|nr:MAG: hypothetical protein CBARDCOR_6406 [uncultured Caballeronia sp.]
MALPVLRPLAFRTWHYLIQGFQDELNHSLVSTQRMRDDLVNLKDAVHGVRAELLHEIHHTHALGLEVLQKTAVSVQHEVLSSAHHWHVTERQEAQVSFSDLHQAIQFARESVRDDVLRTALTTTVELREAVADMASKQQSEAHAQQLEAQAHKLEEYAQSAAHAHQLEGYAQQLETYAASTFTRLDRIEHLGHIAARRIAVHGESGIVLVKTEVGYVLCSDSDHAMLACLLETGELEFGTRVLIERFLKPAMSSSM